MQRAVGFFLIPGASLFLKRMGGFAKRGGIEFIFFQSAATVGAVPIARGLRPTSPVIMCDVPARVGTFSKLIPTFGRMFGSAVCRISRDLGLIPCTMIRLNGCGTAGRTVFTYATRRLVGG